MKRTFELAAFNLADALEAATLGVDRIEFCKDYSTGGLTPDLIDIFAFKKQFDIPVFIMISPTAGDYYYGDNFDSGKLKDEVKSFKDAGADGFVFGAILKNEHMETIIDVEKAAFLIECADGLPCTFHRAFDIVTDQIGALDQIIGLGYKRILTSGNPGKAIDHFSKLIEFKNHADGKLTILPGGGLRSYNIDSLLDAGFMELHSACVDVNINLDEEEIKRFVKKMVV
jgi:copper homeostasis protein